MIDRGYPKPRITQEHMIKTLIFAAVVNIACVTVWADVLKLSPAGVAAMRATGALVPTTDGGFVVRGRIIVPRDAAGKLTLRDPYDYFMFEPMTGPNRYGPAKRMEWRWLGQRKMELDTIEELRGIVSNRDQKYGSWQAAFDALRKEIDTDDSIFHLRARGGAAASGVGGGVEQWEGWLSRNFIAGHVPGEEEIKAYQTKLRNMPRGDPRGMRPTDPLFQVGTGGSTVGHLLEAIARAEKYGEPEPGFLEAARAVAKFISEDLYPAPDAQSGPSRDKAMFILQFVSEARMGLLSLVPLYPNLLEMRLQQPSRFGNKPEDHFRVDSSYIPFNDVLAINQFDVAKAAVGVASQLTSPREGDGGNDMVLDKLLVAASGRADFRAHDPTVRLPAELTPMIDQVGKLAFDKLLELTRTHDHYRKRLIPVFLSKSQVDPATTGTPSLMAAGTEAVVLTGVAKPSDVVLFVDAMWEMGLVYERSSQPWSANAASILQRVPNSSPAAAGNLFRTYLAKRIRDFQKRQELGAGTPVERAWLARFR